MPSGSGPTPTSKPISDRKHSIDSNEISKNAAYTRSVSYDPIDYVQKARVTKTAPPKPAYNPLQFVQLKPSNLFVNAQEQVKKAEEVKKNKEVTKEEPEDWQCNLDNWKSSRRKRVEHIIDRVVEVKKLELVEHDRNRKKSATFSEMMEKRGARSKLAVYNDDDTNDLSDLGIGTSSASGKSSLSDDFDNHSVISDNQDTEKSFEMESITRSEKTEIIEENNNRDYTSSPGTGYDTSSSAAPTSSPDPSEYTYEGAIQEYKSRVSRAGQIFNGNFSKETSEQKNGVNYYISPMKKHSFPTSKFDDRYMEIIRNNNNNNNDSEKEETAVKLDLPKVDIHKRKELFEKASIESSTTSRSSAEIASTKSIKERLSSLEQNNITTEACKKSATDIAPIINSVTIKDRLVNLEKEVEVSVVEKVTKTELPLTTISLKDRLSSLQSAVENSATVIIKDEDKLVEKLEEVEPEMEKSTSFIEQQAGTCGEEIEVNPEDSGFHTTDVSYTNSQADENQEEVLVDQQPNLIKVKENNCDNITTHQAEEAPETVQENICPSDNDDLENEQDISTLDDALEMAFLEIDNEKHPEKTSTGVKDPIYENIDESDCLEDVDEEEIYEDGTINGNSDEGEPYYQVPKFKEPYYEVPKPRPVPLYENVDIFYSGSATNKNQSTGNNVAIDIDTKPILQPPKEKPPPPPVENTTDDETEVVIEQTKENFKRINSTKRIKKEIRNKRSSFLGIEGNDDYDAFLELSVAPPPDMAALLQEEKRYEKQLYMKAGFYANSDLGDKDSGVSENHSRQSSEPFTNSFSSEEIDEFTNKKKNSSGANHQKESNGLSQYQDNSIDEEYRMDCIEHEIREQENYHNSQHYQDDSFDEQSEEVLRVERELLQLEQEELKRQRENLLYRENLARRELDHGDKMLMSANRHSLQDINVNVDQYVNYSNISQNYQVQSDYGQSMPDLQNMQDCVSQKRIPPPVPPAKPLRASQQQQHITHHSHQDYQNITECTIKGTRPTLNNHEINLATRNSSSITHSNNNNEFVNYNHSQASPEEFVQLRNYNQNVPNNYSNMSKHVIHALSAAPKPKLTNDWIQHRRSYDPKDYIHSHDTNWRNSTNTSEYYRFSKQQQQIKKKNDLNNYNHHWLIQEAEQRRIEQQRSALSSTTPSNGWTATNGSTNNKKSPLPDSIIQTITQRVQSLGIGGDKKRQLDGTNSAVINLNVNGNNSVTQEAASTDKVLSVSGKKKCSHCNMELGRGAAMIIESLRLFYHIECFKCSVCHVQLGDGLNGTDVRVRNHKLHCQNCYSSDDGVKFSCV